MTTVFRCSAAVVLAGTVLCLLARGTAAQGAGQQSWWLSPAVQTTIALTPPQAARIDAIYRESLPERRRLRQQTTMLRRRLARLFANGPMSDADAVPLIDRLCTAEKQRKVARTMMLVRMNWVLTPAQRLQLADLSLRLPGSAEHSADPATAFFLP